MLSVVMGGEKNSGGINFANASDQLQLSKHYVSSTKLYVGDYFMTKFFIKYIYM